MSQQAVRRRSPIRLPGRQVQLAWRAINSLIFLCASFSFCRVFSSRKAAFGDCRIIQAPASSRLRIDRIRASGDSALNRAASSAITSESEGNLIGKSMRLVSGSVDSSPGMIAGFELLGRPDSESFDQETGGPRQRVPISAGCIPTIHNIGTRLQPSVVTIRPGSGRPQIGEWAINRIHQTICPHD